MRIVVDISLYPLCGDFIPPIRSFIDRLAACPGLTLEYNSLSTQVSGEIDAVFAALRAEIGRTFAGAERAVVVMKMLGGGPSADEGPASGRGPAARPPGSAAAQR
jgi:uncharacterized protein YqgV (UPF0045/DUF77 family)